MANLDSFLGGWNAGNQIAETGRAQRNRAMVGNLAPAILGGDPQAFAKVAAVDPAAAKDLQLSGEGLMKRTRGAAQYLEQALKSGNQAQITAARRSAKPFLDTLQPGASYPLDMDPQQELAGIQSFLAQTAYLDPTLARGTPSQFTALDMQAKAAGYQPGTQGYMDFFRRANGELARQSSAAIQYKEVPGPDGRPMLVALDPREVGAMTVGGGPAYGSYAAQSGSNAPNATTAAGESVFIDPSLPPEVRSAIMATPDAASIDLAPTMQRSTVTAAANPFAGRRPEDTAAATERAKLQAQLDYLPQEQAIRTQAAIEQAGGIDAIKRQQEKSSGRVAAEATVRDAENNLDRMAAQARQLMNHQGLSRITGVMGAVPDYPGSDAANARAELESLKSQVGFGVLQAMREASKTGGALGSVSDTENQLLQSNLAALSNSQSLESFRQNLQKIIDYSEGAKSRMRRAFNEQYGQQQGQGPRPQGPARQGGVVQRARNPQTGEVLELRNGQWVPAQ